MAGGSADFSVDLIVAAICPPSSSSFPNGIGRQDAADYLDPLTIRGAAVYDANGNLAPDPTIVSQTGYSPPAATPEPASVLLRGTGLLGLA